MPRFTDLPPDFRCPYREGCPYLEGLPAGWVWRRYQDVNGSEGRYEYQLGQLHQQLDQERRQRREVELENQRLRAQLHALHRRQFQGRRVPAPPPPDRGSTQPKKRGAPVGHPPWRRAQPQYLDQVVAVPAPESCPDCHNPELQPREALHLHVQEDIVLQPRTLVTGFLHQQAYCAPCHQTVWQPGPGEMPGAYIGPAAKATALYLRYQLQVSDRRISQFFADFFGLKFVPASAYGFERQAVRRGRPLYADLLDKVRSLPVAHADETSWRHDGQNYWVWYAGDDDLAAFLWQAHRSTQAAQELLGEKFDGVLVADAFASYNGVQPKDRQSCLAHIKTKAKELEQELALLPGRAADPAARQFCQNVQSFVQEACRAHRQLCRQPWRAQAAQDQGQNLRHQLDQLCQTPLRHPRTETFRQRLAGPEQHLFFTCFRHPNVPPTNNQAERSLRPVVLMRKVIQATRSQKGLENHTVLRSLFETARRQGRKPQQFFLDLLTQTTAQAQAALYRHPPARKSKPAPLPQPLKPP